MKRWSSLRRTAAPIPFSAICATVAHRRGARPDCPADVLATGAAAEISLDPLPDLPLVRVRVAADEVQCTHDHAGSTEAALQPVMFPKGFLHRVQPAVRGHTLDRPYLRALRLHREHRAALDGIAVDVDDAGTALA